MACFMARRKLMRFSSWAAMFSATSWALASGLRISMMFTFTGLPISLATSARMASTPTPPLPMSLPGRAVWMLTVTLLAARSMSILATPAA